MSKTIDWTPVEEAAQEKTVAGLKIALLEAVKILDQRLTDERLPGRTTEERFDAARFHFTKPDQVKKAVDFVTELRSGDTGGLTKQGGERHLQSLRQAVADLNDLSQKRDNILDRAKMYLGLLKGKQRWLLNTLFGVAGFFIAVLFLADTAPGQLLVEGILLIVHTFFSWFVTLLISLAVLVLVILGTAVYLDRRPGGRIKDEES